jgi:hypothetical protein
MLCDGDALLLIQDGSAVLRALAVGAGDGD